LAPRTAVLIAALALVGCLKAQPTARQQAGCGSCHERHHLRDAACHECHRGDPSARRVELAHERLLTGRVSEHRLPDGPALREGRRLVERLACRRCHRVAGEGNRLATDLDRVVWTREQGPLVGSIREPVENMPRFGLDARQAQAIVAYLLRSGSRDQPQDSYRVHFARGGASPTAFGRSCGGCHRFLSASGPRGSGNAGPNLSGLFTASYPETAPGKRPWTERGLAEWLRNPRASRSTTTMPPLALTQDELRSIAAELGGPGAPSPGP
jgi:cytochrome c1